MKKLALALSVFFLTAAPVLAQVAPAPRSAPRTPVNRETLAERRANPPRDVVGQALIIDGDKLRIGEVDLRLFGIVAPQLSASFGPQARAALDAATASQNVSCHIRDRDHDGRLIANCMTSNSIDPAQDLLRRGLAVAARGSIADSELAEPYIAAEQGAQNQKIGLWSMMLPAAAAPATATLSPATVPTADVPKLDAAKVDLPPKPLMTVDAAKDVQPKIVSVMMPAAKPVASVDAPPASADMPGFFARYQILITGFLMLATALGILVATTINRRIEKRDEMKALAAALRGELLAACAVCQTRIKSIRDEADDRATSWPKIRATLYQAYVGKLGWLGAELARQVASIYGQASDYASYYNTAGETAVTTPKRQALQILVSHIEEILPRLAGIEQTGNRHTAPVDSSSHYSMPAPPEHRKLAEPVVLPQPVVIDPSKPEMIGAVPATNVLATTEPSIEDKLRSVMRNFRERFIEQHPHAGLTEEPMGDYTAMIEEDIEHMSFSETDDDDLTSFNKISRH